VSANSVRLREHPLGGLDDYWRMRTFLRRVFLANNRREHSWHVARLDYWRWHFILGLRLCESVKAGSSIWETADGEIVAALNTVDSGEIRLHVDPRFRTPELEDEMVSAAERRFSTHEQNGGRLLYLPVDWDDTLRHGVLSRRGFTKGAGTSNKWRRELDRAVPATPVPAGYTVRSMGGRDEHASRSWASWRAFHADEPDEAYDGDWSWFANVQAAPLYRRDLDMVAISPGGEVAAFCTIYYDDATRSAVCVLVGTAAEHQRRGLGKAVMLEGFRRLRKVGCTLVMATGYDARANALYGSVMDTCDLWETWLKRWP
jgi:mycothiol synthase